MKYVLQHISISIYLIVLMLFSGCVSLSTYQSPKIIEKGDAQVGVGMLAGFGGNSEVALGELSLIGRYGISDRFDIGGKVYGMPHIVKFLQPIRGYSLSNSNRSPLCIGGVGHFHI